MVVLRLACRDLRGALGGFWLLMVCVALGTAAIASIGGLSAMILDGVRAGGRLSIGGDVSLRLFHQPPDPAHLKAFSADGTASLSVELRPLVHHGAQQALVELRAVDSAYPLYGALALEPAIAPAEALGRRDGMWGAAVAAPLLTALGAALGDVVEAGGQRFELRALIREEPDRALRGFTLGPRMIVALPAIAGSDLVAPGTQTYWYTRLRLNDGWSPADWIANFERRFPESGYRIVNADEGVPGVERSLALVTSLLSFVALGMLLIGGVGIASSVGAYLERKRDTIATLKSLGATSRTILGVYLVQVVAAALGGIALGLGLGALLPLAALPLLPDWLPAYPAVQLRPLIVAGGFGLLAALLFSLWPLAKAGRQSPQALFRQLVAAEQAGPASARLWVAMVLLAAALAALFVWSAPLPVIAGLFAAAAVVGVLAFIGLGRLCVLAARKIGQHRLARRPVLRLTVANLHRPGAPTASLIMAMGLSLTVLVAVTAIRENADRHLADTVPAMAPDLVLLNLPPEEGARFDAALEDMPQVARWQRLPFLHGRVDRIAGRKVTERPVPADMGFVIRGDRGLSWRAAPPERALVAGEWWPADYTGPTLLSLDGRVADRLGLSVGDTLTLNIHGAPLTARIANLRHVDWSGLEIDFPILLSPPADPPPYREIAALWMPPQSVAATRTALAALFPKSPTILVDEVIDFFGAVARDAGRLLSAASSVAGLAALLVLGGAVAASQQRRGREAVLLKVLGATRRQVMAVTILEFALVGGAACLLALLHGNLAAWTAIGGVMAFRPSLGPALPWSLALLGLMTVVGVIAAAWSLARPVGRVLRQD
ncbi:MAG: FtsX-like permease family protein [Alphaproteobacteria bacterium]|nr:FtsX-like permease family protein [Alphaproteobacteria bacterium]